MTRANIFKIEEVGKDYAVFGNTRYNFADDETGTKEEAAAFFRGLLGKDAAIDAAEPVGEPGRRVYVGVDFMGWHENNVNVVPIPFRVSSIEIIP
jgi:hypothetical protein